MVRMRITVVVVVVVVVELIFSEKKLLLRRGNRGPLILSRRNVNILKKLSSLCGGFLPRAIETFVVVTLFLTQKLVFRVGPPDISGQNLRPNG